MPLTFDTRPAAYAVVIRDKHILLAYWKEHGHEGWTLPGGGLDPGEHPVDGCQREVFEETGYRVVIGAMLGTDVRLFGPGERFDGLDHPYEALRIFFVAEVTGGELTHEVGGSTTHAAWLPLAELAHLRPVPLVQTALRLYTERPSNGQLDGPDSASVAG